MPFSTPSPMSRKVPPLKYRTCAVCRRPTVSPWSPYCARCRGHLHDRPENAKRRRALVAAYDPDLDGFRCCYSGAPLEEVDQSDPFYLYFDHKVPRRSSGLVACGAVINAMKSELSAEEFRKAVRELARHHGGRPFRKGAVSFDWWTERAPPPRPGPRLRRGERAGAAVSECVVCGNTTVEPEFVSWE